MTATDTAKPHRDNILGICNALGEDFGFNPFYLRAALAVMLLVDAKLMVICYAAAGVVVLASHLIIRPRRARKPTAAEPGWTPTIPSPRIGERTAVDVESDRVFEPAI